MSAYGFRCVKIKTTWDVYYKISWRVDYHYASDRLIHPRLFSKNVDELEAIKFCKKHNITMREM